MSFEPPSAPPSGEPSTAVEYVESRSRLTTFFRGLLVIPHYFVLLFYGFAASIVVFFAWFILLFTGRWPLGMYDFVAGFARYSAAVTGYYYLLTDAYPPFGGDTAGYPARLELGPPLPAYRRLLVLVRIILMIPVSIIAYVLQLVALVGAFIAWLVIVIIGRQPRGLQEMIELGFSYSVRAQCYYLLLSEAFPAFSNPTGLGAEPSVADGSGPG